MFWLKISKTIQMLVRWHRDGPLNADFKLHQYRVRDYLWSVTSEVHWWLYFMWMCATLTVLVTCNDSELVILAANESLKLSRSWLCLFHCCRLGKDGLKMAVCFCNLFIAMCSFDSLSTLVLLIIGRLCTTFVMWHTS